MLRQRRRRRRRSRGRLRKETTTPETFVSPASAGSGAEAFGAHEVVGVASLATELAVEDGALAMGSA